MFAVILVGLLGWSILVGARISRPLFDWLVRASRGERTRGIAITVAVHLVALIAAVMVVLVVLALDAGSAGQRIVAVIGVMALGPWFLNFLPAGSSGARHLREDLERAGASRADARAMAWTAVPFAFAEMAVSISALFPAFLD